MRKDQAFAKVDLEAEMAPEHFIGRSGKQVDEFLTAVVEPLLARCAADPDDQAPELKV